MPLEPRKWREKRLLIKIIDVSMWSCFIGFVAYELIVLYGMYRNGML